MEANEHHLVLGELEDFITGDTITDTLDERSRQKIAHFLVESCDFTKEEIEKSCPVKVSVDNKTASLKLDFLVSINGKGSMLVRFAPGSLVTRRRSTVAMSRIVLPYQIPVAVMTNGEDAEVLDGKTGMLLGTGFSSIPKRADIEKILEKFADVEIPAKNREMALRIVYAFEVDGSCPCDTDICRE